MFVALGRLVLQNFHSSGNLRKPAFKIRRGRHPVNGRITAEDATNKNTKQNINLDQTVYSPTVEHAQKQAAKEVDITAYPSALTSATLFFQSFCNLSVL